MSQYIVKARIIDQKGSRMVTEDRVTMTPKDLIEYLESKYLEKAKKGIFAVAGEEMERMMKDANELRKH